MGTDGSPVRARTLVMMVGGATFGECTAMHELMKERSREIILNYRIFDATDFLRPGEKDGGEDNEDGMNLATKQMTK